MKPLVERYEQNLTTEVLPLETFFNAEDYHQKYVLQRHDGIMKKLKAAYPEFDDLVDSTAAARLNGFAYGCGSKKLFEAERESYGLTAEMLTTIESRI